MTKKKINSKKWKIYGFYFDGKDHFDMFKDEKGNVKNVKQKKQVKVCKK